MPIIALQRTMVTLTNKLDAGRLTDTFTPRRITMDKLEFRDDEFFKASFTMHVWPPKCVQVAMRQDAVGVRDSKDPEKTTLYFSPSEWHAFVQGVKAGEFDL